ncbi:phosphoribosylformylglycinamidine synthase, purS protein [Leptolyngbya boryana IAM M-101]|jgi:phosphoribosylformylglycinamidine synthase PurS subunit|nr:phosphoribosylformylglycinamidine synthase, purS protein [Leptolyngbya boryana IAM M-101]BAS61817.1 phosphoribosylformylglycinamidine synthase, purS protein [Leptolyngbya boryana dg5]
MSFGTFFTFRTTTVTQKFQAQIYVTLRPSVLDPAGTAVQSGLAHMGYTNVEQIRIGKYVELSLTAESESAARSQLDTICDQLLANPVIENYRIELQALATV